MSVAELIRRRAPAREVLAAAGCNGPQALALADEVKDDLEAFWSLCPSAHLLCRVAEQAGAPFALRASGVDALAYAAAQLIGGPALAEALREDILSEATALRASPGPTARDVGGVRHELDWLVAAEERSTYRVVYGAAWLAKGSALSSCTCGEEHGWQAEECLSNALNALVRAMLAWGETALAESHGASDGALESRNRDAAVGQFACDFLRESLDLDLLGLGGSWSADSGAAS